MNIVFTPAATAALCARPDLLPTAQALLGAYSAGRNRHYQPGKTTLKRIQRDARQILGLRGVAVFEARP